MNVMKSKDDNLEKNISRLVKLTGDSNTPGKEFSDSVIEEALVELDRTGTDQTRAERNRTMKHKWTKILAYAASILIVCGAVIALTLPKLNQRVVYKHLAKAKREVQYDGRTFSPGNVDEMLKQAADRTLRANMESYDESKVHSPKSVWTPSMGGGRTGSDRMGRPVTSFVSVPSSDAEPGASRPRMAHGGITPPNGEDVDAMFFKNYGVNPFVDTEDDHLSTFATDVDTGSYTVARRYLLDGHLPPNDAVRVEEFVNYFKYDYPAPEEDVFAVYSEAIPWRFGEGRKNSHLLRLGLKAMEVSEEDRKPAVLTFVIDVSGSMNRENRLGLVKRSLRMLVERLNRDDRIGIAVYGSRGRKVMDHRRVRDEDEILAAIESLHSQGSTYAEEGIRIGYEMAEDAFRRGYINRVILCSDGVANVGRTGADGILEVIKSRAKKGITLSAIGFGMGNYNDVLMETLGDKGNGYYAYVDSIAEARKLFGENLTGTLQVVARDVKVQVDFNPEVVRSYRLIGYENRDVPDEKFRADTYDGGEMGAGHSTTALYELKLWPGKEGDIATTYVRYKDADTFEASEFNTTLRIEQIRDGLADASREFRLAATVGEFAEILRKSYWAKGASLAATFEQAHDLSSEFKYDADVVELVDLIAKARELSEAAEPEFSDRDDSFLEP